MKNLMLETTEARLILGDERSGGTSLAPLDDLVEIDEREAARLGETASERGFSTGSVADKEKRTAHAQADSCETRDSNVTNFPFSLAGQFGIKSDICLFLISLLMYIRQHSDTTISQAHLVEDIMSLPRFAKEWDGFKGHVAVKWDKIQDEDLIKIEGNFGKLVSLIADRYGEQKSVVEAKLHELYANYLETRERLAEEFSELRENVNQRTHDIAENIRNKAGAFQDKAKEQISKIREQNIDPAVQKSEEYIKVHPFSAVLGAFGVGILIGGIIGLLTNHKD